MGKNADGFVKKDLGNNTEKELANALYIDRGFQVKALAEL